MRASAVANVKTLTPVKASGECLVGEIIEQDALNKDTTIIQLRGNLYFGSASDLERKLSNAFNGTSAYELRFSGVTLMDVTCLEIIESFINRVLGDGKRITLTGINPQINTMLDKAHITEHVGKANIFMQDDTLVEESDYASTSHAYAAS